MIDSPQPSRLAAAFGPAVIALVAWLAVLLTLDGVGERPSLPEGPGLTLDEIFNIQTGVYLWRSLIDEGPSLFTPAVAERVFRDPLANPDHPPLGRVLIGLAHDLTLALAPPVERAGPYSVACARVAPATAFALTVLLVGWVTGRWYGRTAGWVAAASLVLMPRVFGHAHLAALETFVGLTFTATVLYVGSRWHKTGYERVKMGESEGSKPSDPRSPSLPHPLPPSSARPIPWASVFIAGVLFGLTLLTKIQAVLLPVPVGLWCLWRWGWRAVPLMLVFGLVGLAVFFAAWPWLWLDPVGHFLQYLGRATDRPTLYCYYLGERYADRAVPWHYPFVMFAVTVPIGLQALGVWSCCRLRWSAVREAGESSIDVRAILLLITVLFVFTFFALPGITVYDGERLFLVAYPLWAVLIGRGAQCLKLGRFATRRVTATLAVLIAAQAVGNFALHPCQLSYSNALVAGLAGADRLGFERIYWRDSFTRDFLTQVADRVPEGSTLYVAPVLHPANRLDLAALSPILTRRDLTLDAYDDKDPSKADMRYVLVFRRRADSWDSLEPAPAGGKLLAEVAFQGVQLAALYDLRPGAER